MSDELRDLYVGAGLIDRYFDDTTPVDLYRAQTFREEKAGIPKVYPNPGYALKTGGFREPDVRTFERNGEQWVAGCRTIRGDHRGVSMFDRVNPRFRGGTWYVLDAGAEIPVALAILQDGTLAADRETHFTIAPKDDMPMALFQTWLNALGDRLKKA